MGTDWSLTFQSPDGDSLGSDPSYVDESTYDLSSFNPLTGILWGLTGIYVAWVTPEAQPCFNPLTGILWGLTLVIRRDPQKGDCWGFNPLTGILWGLTRQ